MLLTLKFSLKSLELICREESTVESFRNCVFSLMYLLCACISYFSPTISIRMLLYQLWIILVISGAHMQKLYNYGEKKKVKSNLILYQENAKGKNYHHQYQDFFCIVAQSYAIKHF